MKQIRKVKDAALVELGQVIAEMRRAKGFTQEKFGELVGVHYKYISQIEQGSKNLTWKTLEQILERGHGIKPSTLFFGIKADSQREENARMIALLHQLLRTGSKRERRGVLALLEVFTARAKS